MNELCSESPCDHDRVIENFASTRNLKLIARRETARRNIGNFFARLFNARIVTRLAGIADIHARSVASGIKI